MRRVVDVEELEGVAADKHLSNVRVDRVLCVALLEVGYDPARANVGRVTDAEFVQGRTSSNTRAAVATVAAACADFVQGSTYEQQYGTLAGSQ